MQTQKGAVVESGPVGSVFSVCFCHPSAKRSELYSLPEYTTERFTSLYTKSR